MINQLAIFADETAIITQNNNFELAIKDLQNHPRRIIPVVLKIETNTKSYQKWNENIYTKKIHESNVNTN